MSTFVKEIHPVFVIFRDPAKEKDFLVWSLPKQFQFFTKLLNIGIPAIILFAIPDYIKFGLNKSFYLSLLTRIFLSSALCLIVRIVERINKPLAFHWLLFIAANLITINTLTIIFLMQNHSIVYALSELIAIIAIYIFLEQRFFYSLLSAVPASLLILMSHAYYGNLDSSSLQTIVFAFFLANGMGMVYNRNINMSSRKEYQGLLQEKKLNEKLEIEVKQRRQAEEDLVKHNLTLEERIRQEIASALEKEQYLFQQAKLISMGEMIGAIAHQWRQPLNALALIVQDISEADTHGDLNPEYLKKFVAEALEYIRGMSQTIDDFQNFSNPSKERIGFSLHKAIMEAVKIAQPQLKKSHIDLKLPGFPERGEDIIVHGYPNEFKQVVLNILMNARDAIIDHKTKIENPDYTGKIEISIKESHPIKISFSDNGGGIHPDALKHIFEPYFTTKDVGFGAGIGLYIAKKIIEQSMCGWIFAENQDQGALITIILPSSR